MQESSAEQILFVEKFKQTHKTKTKITNTTQVLK